METTVTIPEFSPPAPVGDDGRVWGQWDLFDAIYMLRDGYHVETVMRRTGIPIADIKHYVKANGRGRWSDD